MTGCDLLASSTIKIFISSTLVHYAMLFVQINTTSLKMIN